MAAGIVGQAREEVVALVDHQVAGAPVTDTRRGGGSFLFTEDDTGAAPAATPTRQQGA